MIKYYASVFMPLKNLENYKTLIFIKIMLFNQSLSRIIKLIILTSIIVSCGGNDCKYPENKNGIWEEISTTKVIPINPNVVLQANTYGAITLRDGTTEEKARDNLWTPVMLKFSNGASDAIVEAGNQIRLNVSDSIVLAGYLQQIPVTLKSWINPSQQPYSFSKIEDKDFTITNHKPTSVDVITHYNPDDTQTTYRAYNIEFEEKKLDEQGNEIKSNISTTLNEKIQNENTKEWTNNTQIKNYGSCQSEIKLPSSTSVAKPNYAFQFVDRIVFDTFPEIIEATADGELPQLSGSLKKEKVSVSAQLNELICKIKDDNGLRYVCEFTYKGLNWSYRRRVKPAMLNGYPQFEEQLICEDCETSDEEESGSTATEPKIKYHNNHHFVFCIVGGSTATQDYCYNQYGYDHILYSESSTLYDLPAGYVGIEYLESSGQQRINTGVKLDQTGYQFQVKYKMTNGTSTCKTQSTEDQAVFGMYAEDGGCAYRVGIGPISGFTTTTSDGIITATSSVTNCVRSNYSLYLFAKQRFNDGRTDMDACARIYSVKMWKNGTLYRDFYPCYRESDGNMGFYDKVTNTFIYNTETEHKFPDIKEIGSISGYKVGSDGSKSKHSLIKVYFKKFDEVYPDQKVENINNPGTYTNQPVSTTIYSSNTKHKRLCKAFPKTISYSLNKYKDAGFGWVNRENSTDQESIKYCSNNCIDLCTEYFKGYTHDEIISLGGNDDVGAGEKYLLHFWKYVPTTDIKNSSYITNDNYKTESTGCGCNGFKGHLLTTISGWQTLTSQINNACKKADGWYGLYASASTQSGNILNYVHNNSAVRTDFQIVKLLRSWNGVYNDVWTSGSNLKSYFLCSPYSLQTGQCDYENGTGQCRKSNNQCYSLGRISYTSASLDLQCPVKCEKPIWEQDQQNVFSENRTTNFEVVSQIEYTIAPRKNGDRQGQLSDNEDNTIYYEINNGNTIDYGNGYLPLREGLLTTESPEITEIVCADEVPENLSEVSSYITWSANSKGKYTEGDTKIETKYTDSCRINADFKAMSSLSGSNTLKFWPQTDGIIPIQWSSFTVAPGDSVPITISVAGSGGYPALVKTNGGIYSELSSGNGLVMYLQPNEDDIPNVSLYAQPDQWQCNVGTGGSYGFYKPYKFDEDGSPNTCGQYNKRHVRTHSTMWWYCDKPVSMWFSGYDYDGIKTGKPFAYHKYTFQNLQYIMPNYKIAAEDTSVGALGCSADGVPKSITLQNNDVISVAANQLTLVRGNNDVAGSVYQFNDKEGNLRTISVNDSSQIKRKTFTQYSPEMIVSYLPKVGLDGVTITKSRNGLKRELCNSNDNLAYCYKFTYEGQEMSIDISSSYIGRNGVYMAECLETASSGSDKDNVYSGAKILTELPYDADSDYYYSPDEGKTIYTRLGPFSGFTSDNEQDVIPVVYQLHNLCMGNSDKFIYDEQGTDYADEEGLGSVYSYLNATGTDRKNLERSWRIELGNPDLEEWSDDPEFHKDHKYDYGGELDGSVCMMESSMPACSGDQIPDIMFVDLSKAQPKLDKKAVLYKTSNGIQEINNTYRFITCPAVGWNNERITTNRADIACKFDGFYDSCNYDATNGMVMEVIKNGVMYECKNADKDVNIQNVITEQWYQFDYDANNGMGFVEYKIAKSDVPTNNRVCFSNTANKQCRSYLKKYITYGYTYQPPPYKYKLYGSCSANNSNSGKEQDDLQDDTLDDTSDRCVRTIDRNPFYMYSLGRAPYMITCGGNNVNYTTEQGIQYNAVYGNTNGKTDSVSTGTMSRYGETFSRIKTRKGIVMQQGLHALGDLKQSKYFARCVPNWRTSEWMLLNNQGDPTSFEKGFSAISGSYFVNGGSTSWSSIKNKYSIDAIHQAVGGMISNDIYSVHCNQSDTGVAYTEPSNDGKTPANGFCTTSHKSQNFPEFKTIYERQVILAKSIINDPVNASNTQCKFKATGSSGEVGDLSLKMNDPFGTQFDNDKFNNFYVDRNETKNTLVSNIDIGNGTQSSGYLFFKFTEIYRNFTGAGIVHPSWWFFTDSNNNPKVFKANQTLKIEPNRGSNGEYMTYFASGNLSHASRGYCLNSDNDDWVGDVENLWTSSLVAVSSVVALGPVGLAIALGLSEVADQNAKDILKNVHGAMINIVEPNKTYNRVNNVVEHNVANFQPEQARRVCGVGTAFRVLPIPHFACMGGYKMRCNNDRINQWVDTQGGGNDTKLASKCVISQTLPNYAGSNLFKVGSCVKQKYSISGSNATGTKVVLMYKDDNKIINNLREQINSNFDDKENVLEDNCGLCLKKNMVQTYNGVSYGFVSDAHTICDPTNSTDCFVTKSDCQNKKDYTNGDEYTWVTQLARLSPWDGYSTEEQEEFFKLVKNKFIVRVQACSATAVFEPTLTDNKTMSYMKEAYTKMGIRNEASCISALESMYMAWIPILDVDDDCKTNLNLSVSVLASASCNEILEKIKIKDSDNYDRYIFIQNASSTSCVDNTNTKEKDDTTGLYSLKIKKNKTEMLQKYGFAELSSDVIVGKNESVSYVIDIPQTIKGKKFKSARVGFAFAGDNTANPMKMYNRFRVKNENDLQRGYEVQLGTGTPAMRGKYLYLYFQPLLSNGTPDPTYAPNAYFSSRTPNFKGITYTPDEVVKNNLVYSYKEFDTEDTGEATFTAPRTGKLWAAIIDAKITDGKGRNTDEMQDGKYVIFKAASDGPHARVSGDNYLGSNSGQYYLTGSVQTDSLDAIDSIVNSSQSTSNSEFTDIYQEVEYIESTGSQYIDTGFQPDSETKIVGKINFTTGDCNFLARDTSNNRYGFYYGNDQKFRFDRANNKMSTIDGRTFEVGKDWYFEIYQGIKIGATANDMFSYYTDTTPFSVKENFGLFAMVYNTDGKPNWYCNAKLYYFKMYSNGNLVRDFIPAYRKLDGVIGLYDKVDKKFYTNDGTGTFLKGGDVINTIVASPKAQAYSKTKSTFVTKTLFSWVIGELKELLIGKWHTAYTDENGKYVPAGYEFEGTKFGFIPSGLMPQVASLLLKQPLIHIAFWLAAVVGMFAFGLQVLFGSAEVKFDLVKKYLLSYAVMTMFLNPSSISFYLRYVVRAAFNLADGLSAYVAGNFAEVNTTYDENDPGQWVAIAFGPMDQILRYFFNADFWWRWSAIILSSMTGWLSAIILLMCLIHFLISALQALILYIMILLQMSLQLAIGPVMFIFLVHEKTRGICINWLKGIAGMIAEQIAMFTAVSAFSTLFYHILKGSMNFIICWEPVIKIPILDVTLFSWYKIAGTLPQHMAELMGEYGPTITGQTDKFSVLTGITLLLITMAMSKFIDQASEFGAKLFGQSSSMPKDLKDIVSKARGGVNSIGSKVMTTPYKFAGGYVSGKATGAIDTMANLPYNAVEKIVRPGSGGGGGR